MVNGASPMLQPGPSRFLTEGVPHQVLEGIFLASQTLKAASVVIYLPRRSDAGPGTTAVRLGGLQGLAPLPAREPLVDLHIVAGKGRFMLEDKHLLLRTIRASCLTLSGRNTPAPLFWSTA